MAINKTINKRTNSHGAMRNCIEYVLRPDKTSELLTYVTGPYRHDEINYDLVYRTFLEEKKMWDKDTGRMYAHNIISWHKDEQITPDQALEFGKEFAEKWFSGFQTLVAVHKDKDHIHCHLVTNSVSYEDGRKLHNTRKDLERMKQLSNQMCRERGLTVTEKGKHFDGSQIEKGEVVAWSKDKYNLFRQQVKDSFVADCAMAVLKALENCISKEKFIEKMKQFGWNVNWTEKRKHIIFQKQDGKKVRDSNLSKTFHLDISKEGWYRYIEWLIHPSELNILGEREYFSAGWSCFLRIMTILIFLGLGISSEIFVLRKIEQYRKAWDKYSIWILLISVSSIAVTGDVVRKYFPINLILLLGLINIAAMEIKIYCHNKRELY